MHCPFSICIAHLMDIISLDEDDVLNGDIYGMIAPYATANFWVCLFIVLYRKVYSILIFRSGGHT